MKTVYAAPGYIESKPLPLPLPEFFFILLVLVGLCNPAILDVMMGQLPREDLAAVLNAEDHARYAAAEGNSRFSLIFWPLVYAISGLLFLRDAMRWSVLQAGALVILFCMFLLGSSLWSDAAQETAMRAIHTTGKTLFILWLVQRTGLRGAFEMFVLAGSFVLLAGWLLAIGKPSVGWMSYRGDWALRGFYTHKNAFGMNAMFVSFLAIGLLMSNGVGRLGRTVLLWAAGIGILSLAFSQSVTAILMLGLALFLAMIGRWVASARFQSHRQGRLAQAIIVAALAIAAVWVAQGVILDFFGRDLTLSRRTIIWESLLASEGNGSLLGHGYYGFWRYVPGSSLYEVVQRMGFATSSPHNAFLLAWLDLGWVGLAIFLTIFAVALRRSLRLLVEAPEGIAALPLALAAVLLSIGSVESNLFTGQEANWILLAMIFSGTGLILRRPVASRSL